VITIGGLHGTGKSTYARILARIYGLKHISAGNLFRQTAKDKGLTLRELSHAAKDNSQIDKYVDDKVREEASKGSTVIDGILSAQMAGDRSPLKIFLLAPDNVRFKRIASRDKMSFEGARKATFEREKIERQRFRDHYEIDIDDLTIYDIVINTGLLSVNSNIKILTRAIEEFVKNLKNGEVGEGNVSPRDRPRMHKKNWKGDR